GEVGDLHVVLEGLVEPDLVGHRLLDQQHAALAVAGGVRHGKPGAVALALALATGADVGVGAARIGALGVGGGLAVVGLAASVRAVTSQARRAGVVVRGTVVGIAVGFTTADRRGEKDGGKDGRCSLH